MSSTIPASNGKTVLITGINGYIASVLGLHLLEKGYSIRGTARRAVTAESLIKGPYAPYVDRFQVFEVPDMTIGGAFDEVVKGVNGIFHTASPIDFSLTKYEAMVVPAVKGAETLLNSALKAGHQLESVVLTSSTIAVVDPDKPPGYVFTEADFAEAALAKAIRNKEEGVDSPSNLLYAASKTASERAVWTFRDTHKVSSSSPTSSEMSLIQKPSFAITTINPSIVMGPPVNLASDPSKLNETLRPVFSLFNGSSAPVPPNFGSANFVDVRDVAVMHIWAYEHPSLANGERYIACSGFGAMQAAADILRYHYRGTEIEKRIAVGKPGEGYFGFDKEMGKVGHVGYPEGNTRLTGRKAEIAMGLKFRSLEQTIVDTAEAFKPLL